ncbi:MAG TPA: T9SS type A sorting domain-containing protein, partial [Candidatus Kapabacteria bacterium]|nr:T9SS type A sorting domain-containing protein [Candidatus Kapabacteria bacterium]
TAGDADQRQSFTLSPVRAGELGEVTFKVYLAEAEQTTLSFDNISFEAAGVSFAPECIAVISDSSSRFNYVYTCGDNVIRDRLNGTRLIKSITPNPASGEIRVELNVAGGIEVSLFNALGTELLKSATDRVDVSALPSGVYYVRVAAAGIRETRRIVVER